MKGISTWGENDSRPINLNYDRDIDVLYYTDGYWYNCISLNAGLGKTISLSKDLQVVTSIDFSNYYNYSQTTLPY